MHKSELCDENRRQYKMSVITACPVVDKHPRALKHIITQKTCMRANRDIYNEEVAM